MKKLVCSSSLNTNGRNAFVLENNEFCHFQTTFNDGIGIRMGGHVPPKNCIILCSTILLSPMYVSRCICIAVMTHVPPP